MRASSDLGQVELVTLDRSPARTDQVEVLGNLLSTAFWGERVSKEVEQIQRGFGLAAFRPVRNSDVIRHDLNLSWWGVE
jgi:hypothetical protein